MSDKRIDNLRNWGCSVDEALERVVDDEEFYMELLLQYKDSFDANEIYDLVSQNRVEDAFDVAHTMKGVYGNLGITPLYDISCQLVELLRNKTEVPLADVLPYIDNLKEKFLELNIVLSE